MVFEVGILDKQKIKRRMKSVRNLFSEPPPRNKQLSIVGVEYSETGFQIRYQAKKKQYSVTIDLPDELLPRFKSYDKSALEPTLCAIALAFSTFFFKLADFKSICLESFALDPTSADFFSKSIQAGMGEFRYIQGLNPIKTIEVKSPDNRAASPKSTATRDHLIMLNGGGKDTIVAGELLRLCGQDFTWVTIRPTRARRSVVELSGNPNSIEVGYYVDENVDADKVYPWGHIPHTSIVLSLGLLVAQLIDARYVCAGNEQSANFGNVNFKGLELNHQYSKSFEYEKNFSDYVSRCVTPDIKVFSILRPFHDIQLGMMFSQLTKYHASFLSCNIGAGRGEWCGSCPKCAFTTLALYPFIGSEGCKLIFGYDVLHSPGIRQHIIELTTAKIKPWECVGTQEESKLALKMILDNNPDLSFDRKPFRSELENIVADFDKRHHESLLLNTVSNQHLIPPEIAERLNTSLTLLSRPLIPVVN